MNTILHPSNRLITAALGTGICLFPVHNSALTIGSGSETFLFLPWLGIFLIMYGLISLYDRNLYSIDPGPPVLYIPMLIIVASGFLRLAIDFSTETMAAAFFLLGLFLLYTAARRLGRPILYALIPFLIIELLSILIYSLIGDNHRRGGLLGAYNYDIATGWLVLGTTLLLWHRFFRSTLWLCLLAAAVFCIVSEEAYLAIFILAMAAFLRKDYSPRLAIPVSLFAIILLSLLITGTAQNYYSDNRNRISQLEESQTYSSLNDYTHDRLEVNKQAILDTSPLGHGYTTTDFTPSTVHLAPLTVSDQLGPLAALSWLFLTAYCLIKTSWKYAWIALISLSLVDHYTWTQMAPFWWILISLSTTIPINDRIFRRNHLTHLVHNPKPVEVYT